MFGISSGDATPPFEMQEGVFNQVAELVELFVIGAWRSSVFSGWDHHRHTPTPRVFDDRRAVIPFIRDQMFRGEAFDQAASLRTICCGTLRNNDSERQTMRIHGQMYLGVKPPFVRLMAWLPPLAPAACGCTLQ